MAKNALNEIKLRLYEPVPDSKKKASLQVTTYRNNPSITVFTNVEGDQNKGTIRASLDTFAFSAILTALSEVVSSEKNEQGKYPSFRIASRRSAFSGKFGETVPESTVIIGREDDGRIYIAVVDGKASNVKFFFGPTEMHNEWAFNGQPIDAGKLSAIYASGWGTVMFAMLASVLANSYEEPEKRDFSGATPKSSPNKDFGGDSNDDFPI